MTRSSKFRSIAAALGALSLVAACGGGSSGPSESLAADQTFRFGLANDLSVLDPSNVDSAVDITFMNEVFAGLYLVGLTAPDADTLVAQLDAPAGFWLTQLAMPTATLVLDQKVITAAGEDAWTTKAETYIGSGPFKMTARVPKQSMDFDPVKNWWG